MQLGAQVVCVKCSIGHEGVEGQPLDKLRHTGNFAALTRKKRKAERVNDFETVGF